jgi:predicted transcriptional regulator
MPVQSRETEERWKRRYNPLIRASAAQGNVMLIELKPEQQKVLDRAVRSGMSPEEVIDQDFAVIQEQHRNEDWMLSNKDAIAAQIEEGFVQAERGELVDAAQAVQILQARRAKRRIA